MIHSYLKNYQIIYSKTQPSYCQCCSYYHYLCPNTY